VTAVSPSGVIRGITIGSFTSVSLSPPVISFAIRNPSRMNAILQETTRFSVHVLRADQVHHSELFAKQSDDSSMTREVDMVQGHVRKSAGTAAGNADRPCVSSAAVSDRSTDGHDRSQHASSSHQHQHQQDAQSGRIPDSKPVAHGSSSSSSSTVHIPGVRGTLICDRHSVHEIGSVFKHDVMCPMLLCSSVPP